MTLPSTANKGTEKKLSELQGVREKAESDLREKVRNLEKELENTNTRLAEFKRRGNAWIYKKNGLSLSVLLLG